jgi:hypothetical protein
VTLGMFALASLGRQIPLCLQMDLSAHWTQKADLKHFERYCKKYGNKTERFVPRGSVGGQNHLRQEGGRYGIPHEDNRDTDDLDYCWNDMMPDVLLRRSLPQ